MPRVASRFTSPPPAPGHHPVVVVGAGLVGLTLALDLAQHGIPVVVLDDDDAVSTGSRAICMAKRSLEIFGRLGLGRRMLEKGVTWNTGRVYAGQTEVFDFDLLPEPGHEYPAFVNLQQYYAEEWLVEACTATGRVDLRWKHALATLEPHPTGATLNIETPAGPYTLSTDWLLACDGANSLVRRTMDLPFVGRVFRDRFLIADIRMTAPFPSERRFWFDPPFHPNQSALLHKQPDDVWRIDLQLGWDADPEAERRPERVIPRVKAMLGPDATFDLEWVSIYTFRCRRLERFVHGRVVFVGDSAHQVSPFGARGGNGGVQDADNLAWKLAAILHGQAPESLIQTYDTERIPAADENILHSTRATDFITPKSPAARAYRDAALALATRFPFARRFVNSGRLSHPCTIPLTTDTDHWPGAPPPGTPAIDAPILHNGQKDWLLHHLGPNFTLLHLEAPKPTPLPLPPAGEGRGEGPKANQPPLPRATEPPKASPPPLPPAGEGRGEGSKEKPTPPTKHLTLHPTQDPENLLTQRYALHPGACVLFRPDQHVLATFHHYDPPRIARAIAAAIGQRELA